MRDNPDVVPLCVHQVGARASKKAIHLIGRRAVMKESSKRATGRGQLSLARGQPIGQEGRLAAMADQIEMFRLETNGDSARAYKANRLFQQGSGGTAVEFEKEPVAVFNVEWNGLRREDVTDGMIYFPKGLPRSGE